MILWVDAQLPPAFAPWLATRFGLTAIAVRDLGLRDATDARIFELARAADAVIVTKDSDFVDLVTRLGPPPRVLWVTCGNVSNAGLRGLFDSVFPAAMHLLESGEPVVEIAAG